MGLLIVCITCYIVPLISGVLLIRKPCVVILIEALANYYNTTHGITHTLNNEPELLSKTLIIVKKPFRAAEAPGTLSGPESEEEL